MKKQALNNPNAQKQEICSPSLQPSLRCYTLAFLAAHLLRMKISIIETLHINHKYYCLTLKIKLYEN